MASQTLKAISLNIRDPSGQQQEVSPAISVAENGVHSANSQLGEARPGYWAIIPTLESQSQPTHVSTSTTPLHEFDGVTRVGHKFSEWLQSKNGMKVWPALCQSDNCTRAKGNDRTWEN